MVLTSRWNVQGIRWHLMSTDTGDTCCYAPTACSGGISADLGWDLPLLGDCAVSCFFFEGKQGKLTVSTLKTSLLKSKFDLLGCFLLLGAWDYHLWFQGLPRIVDLMWMAWKFWPQWGFQPMVLLTVGLPKTNPLIPLLGLLYMWRSEIGVSLVSCIPSFWSHPRIGALFAHRFRGYPLVN